MLAEVALKNESLPKLLRGTVLHRGSGSLIVSNRISLDERFRSLRLRIVFVILMVWFSLIGVSLLLSSFLIAVALDFQGF